jgi:hypothetical protein
MGLSESMSNDKVVKRILTGLPGDELYDLEQPEPGKSYLDLMEQRRWAFWNSKPDDEKSHYQGYDVTPELLKNSLARQVHAELAAIHAPNLSLQICPWRDVTLWYARQMNEEGRHFRLIRDHLIELGGVWDDDYAPDFPEWNALFGLFMNLDNHFFLDPRKEVVARAAVLNFGIEGWDHLYVQPLFLEKIEGVDPTLHDIYDEVIMPDETIHYQIGQLVLGDYATTTELQRVGVEFLDRQLVAHHRVNAAFKRYHQAENEESEAGH